MGDNNWKKGKKYEEAIPIEVENGVTLKKTDDKKLLWWSKQWINYLKSLKMGARLYRGKSYAKKGQIVSIKFVNGDVIAIVQGTAITPYKVQIQLENFSEKQWSKICEKLASKAIYAAKLLNHEMPQEIEKLFSAEKLELFPVIRKDLRSNCTCPDTANPCKHIAAVYYILAGLFDENPLLIFKLRGKSGKELISKLKEIRTLKANAGMAQEDSNQKMERIAEEKTEEEIVESRKIEKVSIKDKIKYFWQGDKKSFAGSVPLAPSRLNMELLQKLEPSPVNLEGKNLSEILTETYESLTDFTLEEIDRDFKV